MDALPFQVGGVWVQTPVLRYGLSQTVDRISVERFGQHLIDEAWARLRGELDHQLAELGLQVVEEVVGTIDEMPMRDLIQLRLEARVADYWDGTTWSTARAAFEKDQRWLRDPVDEGEEDEA